jgi:hypothetical protein
VFECTRRAQPCARRFAVAMIEPSSLQLNPLGSMIAEAGTSRPPPGHGEKGISVA